MRKPFLAQALFNLFDIQTDALSDYAASQSRRSNNKVAMFDDNGNYVQRVHKDIVNCIQRILIKNKNKMGSGYALVVVFIKE